MARKSAPSAPPRSPIPFRTLSNGEVMPSPPTAVGLWAERETLRRVDAVARRLAMDRRALLRTALGTAAALSVVNTLTGCKRGDTFYDVPEDACDADGVREVLAGDEFVFDIQTHHIDTDPGAAWWAENPGFRAFFEFLAAQQGCSTTELDCLSRAAYIEEIFVNSDTDVAVLSGVPSPQGIQPLDNAGIQETRRLVDSLAASQRLVAHGVVLPNLEAELDGMGALLEAYPLAGWKSYTQWGPTGTGWFFDDDAVGTAFVERVRALDGPKLICVHKGLALGGLDPTYASPRDIGPAAARWPDVQFVVYHCGRASNRSEGPYDPTGSPGTLNDGSNRLVRSVLDAGLSPNGNVWAELGSAWNALIPDPEQAAHLLGKMLLYIGEDRVVWGSDCIWYGSPQAHIEAFRAFSIPQQMQVTWGYPALTPALKAKILGLNAAALYGIDPDAVRCTLDTDELSARKQEPRHLRPESPPFYGPATRRELLALWRKLDGRPG